MDKINELILFYEESISKEHNIYGITEDELTLALESHKNKLLIEPAQKESVQNELIQNELTQKDTTQKVLYEITSLEITKDEAINIIRNVLSSLNPSETITKGELTSLLKNNVKKKSKFRPPARGPQ